MILIEKGKIFWKVCGPTMDPISFIKFYRTKVNPGARRRLKFVQDEQEIDSGGLDFEADFESLHNSHKEHMMEIKMQREQLQYNIVKQKYFKSKYPNFLTWHDKEQIKLLYSRDPQEWNVNKLSEGFPALPEIIKKILKSNWKKESLTKMKSHDAAVQENWRKLKNDEYNDLPINLLTHLKKFTGRQMNFREYENKVNDEIQFTTKNISTEFSDIITSYEKLEKHNSQKDNFKNIKVNSNDKYSKNRDSYEEDTYVSGQIKNHHLVTLDTLKNELEENVKRGQQISSTDIQIVEMSKIKTKSAPTQTTEMASSKDQLAKVKYHTACIAELDEGRVRDNAHLVYPEKIIIPKKILKRGCTYKLNDCYYDSDGKFLYRVPGMY